MRHVRAIELLLLVIVAAVIMSYSFVALNDFLDAFFKMVCLSVLLLVHRSV